MAARPSRTTSLDSISRVSSSERFSPAFPDQEEPGDARDKRIQSLQSQLHIQTRQVEYYAQELSRANRNLVELRADKKEEVLDKLDDIEKSVGGARQDFQSLRDEMEQLKLQVKLSMKLSMLILKTGLPPQKPNS